MSDSSYFEEIKEYQLKMERQLRAPDGWLTLAGLHWLKEGNNSIGSARSSMVTLPAYSAPQDIGNLVLADGKVYFHPEPGIDARVNNEPLQEIIALESDIDQNPTVITLGDLSFFVVIRGDRIGVRVKQVNNPRRLNFSGRIWWPIAEDYRINARIEAYHPPKMVSIPDILGDVNESAMDSALKFELEGQSCSLDAYRLSSDKYYILFHDLSCGHGSYPAGRFLVTEYPDKDMVEIDFNKAYNPPCAFTPYATCPLPPQQNYLKTQIFAGERYNDQQGNDRGV
jgi:uncharacterized protein (DUF1684 family)